MFVLAHLAIATTLAVSAMLTKRCRRMLLGGMMQTIKQPELRKFRSSTENGWVAERLKAPVLKTGRPARVSWVRIPPHPPETRHNLLLLLYLFLRPLGAHHISSHGLYSSVCARSRLSAFHGIKQTIPFLA